MSKYYNAEDVIRRLAKQWMYEEDASGHGVGTLDGYSKAVKELLKDVPTIEVSEGKWIAERYCSNCEWDKKTRSIPTNYCPNCGAKMKGQNDEENGKPKQATATHGKPKQAVQTGDLMNAIEFLNQYREADRRAKRFKTEYEQELELIDTVKSTADIDGLPRGNGIKKPVEDKAIKLADKAIAWKIAELDAIEVRQKVFDAITNIKGDEGDLLYLRYVKLMKWNEIADEMGYTERWVHQIKKNAWKIFERVHCSSVSLSVK